MREFYSGRKGKRFDEERMGFDRGFFKEEKRENWIERIEKD